MVSVLRKIRKWRVRFAKTVRNVQALIRKGSRRRMDWDFETFWEDLKDQFRLFLVLLTYWIFEALMLIVWISFGIGFADGCEFFYNKITSKNLDNSIESYITLYTLAFGIGVQTNFNLVFVEYKILRVKKESPLLYCIFKTWPLRILAVASLVELLLQFQLRYGTTQAAEGSRGSQVSEQPAITGHEAADDESVVTLRFLMALVFVAYSLGMKSRRDYRMDEIRSAIPFVCPGLIKYCAIFGLLYTMELAMLFLWGFPIILLALTFRYYFFNPFVTYFGLLFLGIVMGYATSIFERDADFRELFRDHESYPLIHGEVRCNMLLFTIMPLISRWYFRIQVHYPDFETSTKVNFILFSVNVSILLMYFVKCVLIYRFKLAEQRGARRRRRNRRVAPVEIEPDRAVLERIQRGIELESSTTSTGTFSDRSSSSSSSSGFINVTPKTMEGQSSINLPETSPDSNTNNNGNGNYKISNSELKDANLVDIECNQVNCIPLRGPFGIMKIDKVWRDQMVKNISHPEQPQCFQSPYG